METFKLKIDRDYMVDDEGDRIGRVYAPDYPDAGQWLFVWCPYFGETLSQLFLDHDNWPMFTRELALRFLESEIEGDFAPEFR
jgi:hypothetical protein